MSKPLFALLTTMMLTSAIALPPTAWAQRVVEVNPALNSQNVSPTASISGQFDASVDTASVRIFVNGQDVTSRSTITRSFFSYRPEQPLPTGTVQVRVEYRSTAGEARTTGWSFIVQPPAPAQITSVTHNAIASLSSGSTLIVTINGTPGAEASILLVQDGRTVRELPARELTNGVYEARLALSSRDRVTEGIAIARLRRNNQATFAAATAPVVLNASSTSTPSPTPTPQPTNPSTLRPSFTSHRNGDRVSGGFTLVGQTQPNARVQITVTGRVSVLGVNLGSSSTLVNREVTADSSGRFQVEVPAPRLPVPTQYSIRATARSGNETSPETVLSLSSQ